MGIIHEAPLVSEASGTYLIFRLADKLYGLAAHMINEVVRLPEITPLEEAPTHILGVINWRGRTTPVVDLHLRMGRRSEPLRLTDAVIVLEYGKTTVGITVNEILEVRTFLPGEMDPTPQFTDPDHRRGHAVVSQVAQTEDELVLLLDPARLLTPFDEESPLMAASEGEIPEISEAMVGEEDLSFALRPPRSPYAHLGKEERRILRERALRLRLTTGDWETHHDVISLAVVELHNELLAMNLNKIRGFAQIRGITPIPCCPPHVLGSMNLRGNILTLIDISRILNIPASNPNPPVHVLLVEHHAQVIGIGAHQILDIIHLRPEEIAKAPTSSGALNRELLQGAALYGTTMFSLVDLGRIFTSPEWIVNDSP